MCTQNFLTQTQTEHTCESAIYMNVSINLIKKLCVFEYFPSQNVHPQVLDDGHNVLLANFDPDWTFDCDTGSQVPHMPPSVTYVLMSKTILCRCTIYTGHHVLRANIDKCYELSGEKLTSQLFFTVNQAVSIYETPTHPHTYLHSKELLSTTPFRHVNLKLKIICSTLSKFEPYPLQLEKVLDKAKRNEPIYVERSTWNTHELKRPQKKQHTLILYLLSAAAVLFLILMIIVLVFSLLTPRCKLHLCQKCRRSKTSTIEPTADPEISFEQHRQATEHYGTLSSPDSNLYPSMSKMQSFEMTERH